MSQIYLATESNGGVDFENKKGTVYKRQWDFHYLLMS